MRTGHIIIAALLAAAIPCVAPQAADAQPVAIFAKIAFDPSIGGTMHGGGAGLVNTSSISVDPQSWTDTHSTKSPLFVAGVDVPVAPGAAVLAGFEYGHAGAETISLGTANGADLRGEFDAYQYWGLEGGVRGGGRTGPYGTATVGFRHVSDIQITTNLTGIYKTPFYKSSNVVTFGFGGGYMFGVIGFEVAVKHAGALTADENAPLTLQTLASEGARWSLPISLVLRF